MLNAEHCMESILWAIIALLRAMFSRTKGRIIGLGGGGGAMRFLKFVQQMVQKKVCSRHTF